MRIVHTTPEFQFCLIFISSLSYKYLQNLFLNKTIIVTYIASHRLFEYLQRFIRTIELPF